jgi:hypothetical protein
MVVEYVRSKLVKVFCNSLELPAIMSLFGACSIAAHWDLTPKHQLPVKMHSEGLTHTICRLKADERRFSDF